MKSHQHSADQKTASPYAANNVQTGALHYVFGRAASASASILSVALLVRFTDVATYARFTAISGIVSLANVLAEMGLERAIGRFLPEGRIFSSPARLRRFIFVLTACRAGAAVALSVAAVPLWPLIRETFDKVSLPGYPAAFAFFLLASNLFQHYQIVLQSLMLQKTLTRLLAIQWFGRLAMIIVAAAGPGISLDAALWIMSIPEMCCALAWAIALHGHLKVLPATEETGKGALDWPAWPRVREAARNNFGYALLVTPTQGYVMVLIGSATMPPYFVAAYGFFVTLTDKVRQYQPVLFFYNLIEPVLVASYVKTGSLAALNDSTRMLHKFNVAVTLPLAVLFIVAGGDIIAAITGGKYAEHAWIMVVLVVQMLLSSHLALLQMVLNTVGASALLLSAAVVGLAVTAAGLALALPVVNGAFVFAPCIFALVNTAWILHGLRARTIDYRIGWRTLLPILAAGLLSLGAAVLARPMAAAFTPHLPPLAACAAASLPAYLAGLWLFSALRPSDMAILRRWRASSGRR